MLALVRSVVARPELLHIDEPLLGLAPAVTEDMMRILRHINETGVSILFIEQNVQTALSIADRGYVLEGGRLVLEGTADELLASDGVKRIFLGA